MRSRGDDRGTSRAGSGRSGLTLDGMAAPNARDENVREFLDEGLLLLAHPSITDAQRTAFTAHFGGLAGGEPGRDFSVRFHSTWIFPDGHESGDFWSYSYRGHPLMVIRTTYSILPDGRPLCFIDTLQGVRGADVERSRRELGGAAEELVCGEFLRSCFELHRAGWQIGLHTGKGYEATRDRYFDKRATEHPGAHFGYNGTSSAYWGLNTGRRRTSELFVEAALVRHYERILAEERPPG